MSGCNAVTYHGINQKVFDCLKKKLADVHINVPPGNEGDIEGDTPVGKIKGHFKWDGVSNLTVQITEKPWIVSCGKIIGTLHDAVHDCGGSD